MDSARPHAFPPPPGPASAASIDPLMQERLARLTANRTAREAGARTPTGSNGGRGRPAPKGNRKRHAAQGSRTAAVLMSVASTAGLTAYFQHVDSAAASQGAGTLSGTATAGGNASASASTINATAVPTPVVPAATVSTAATATTTAATTTPTTVTATTATAAIPNALADGTYTGATATNRWGPVQVEIMVSGGQITEAVALQTPSADRKSVSINARAAPTLATEVLSAQSAKIDTVSGATYTSKSYRASLQSAIDLAKATAQSGTTS